MTVIRHDRRRRNLRWLVALFTAWASSSVPAFAEVTRVVIDRQASESPTFDGRTVADRGQYERIIGRVFGELDPRDRRNALIQDILLAPRNARGRVEYVAAFSLIKPIDISKATGLLLYEAVNRGNELVGRMMGGGSEGGDEFLAKRGVIILRSGWQADLPPTDQGNWAGKTYTIQVPSAVYPDGRPVTGQVLVHFFNVKGNTAPLLVLQRQVPYLPVSMETSQATLTSSRALDNDGSRGIVSTVPTDEWAWADCTATAFPGKPDPARVCLKHGFDPTLLYQLVFTAKAPLVSGIGFAATRDIVAYFKSARRGDSSANPVGGAVTRAIGIGSSQTGQFVRTFINLGFNEDEVGRIVWDGAIANIAGRQLGLNVRFALADGTATHSVPDGQGPVWWMDWQDRLRGHRATGLLNRCARTHTCPKVFETFGASELWGLRMSPVLVGTDNAADLPLPENVRRYYLTGAPHGGGPGGFSTAAPSVPTSMLGSCTLAANPLPSSDTMRALMVALDEWISKGTAPPVSRYPRLADRTLVSATRSDVGFPELPGAPFTDNFANPQFDYDFGPEFVADDVSGVLGTLPPTIKHVIPALVARVNADGNEEVGVRSVLSQAPLGTYLGWNITASGLFKGQRCGWIGGYLPFAKTKAERVVTRDPRPSLEERYGSQTSYVAAVRAAAQRNVAERFLLREDAERLVQEAVSSGVLAGAGRSR